MNYKKKIAEHPEYTYAMYLMLGTKDVCRISEQDARLFWHYIVPQLNEGLLGKGANDAIRDSERTRKESVRDIQKS
jgi:hypothetical protein